MSIGASPDANLSQVEECGDGELFASANQGGGETKVEFYTVEETNFVASNLSDDLNGLNDEMNAGVGPRNESKQDCEAGQPGSGKKKASGKKKVSFRASRNRYNSSTLHSLRTSRQTDKLTDGQTDKLTQGQPDTSNTNIHTTFTNIPTTPTNTQTSPQPPLLPHVSTPFPSFSHSTPDLHTFNPTISPESTFLHHHQSLSPIKNVSFIPLTPSFSESTLINTQTQTSKTLSSQDTDNTTTNTNTDTNTSRLSLTQRLRQSLTDVTARFTKKAPKTTSSDPPYSNKTVEQNPPSVVDSIASRTRSKTN